MPHLPGCCAAQKTQGRVTVWRHVVREPDVGDAYTNLCLAVDRLNIKRESPSMLSGRDKPALTLSKLGYILDEGRWPATTQDIGNDRGRILPTATTD